MAAAICFSVASLSVWADADAQVDQGNTSGSASVGNEKLAEVIVTAEKLRDSERLLETPIPITVLSAQTLSDTGKVSMKDFYTDVPGLNLGTSYIGGAQPIVTIRGITTNLYTNSTVGSVIDDVPLGSSSTAVSGAPLPDFDPSNFSQVEVLRGPQGTLYGANSMGGLIRYVTVAPSTDGFNARVQVGLTDIYNGAELGYVTRAAVNLPLGDTVAVRISAFDRRDPGYIDNIESGVKGANEANAEGALTSALWKPSEVFSLQLNALLQNYHVNSSGQVKRGLADLQQSMLPGAGDDTVKQRLLWANATLNLGNVQLKSTTSYSLLDTHYDFDLGLVGFASQSEKYFGVTGTLSPTDFRTNKFTQELHLDVPLGTKLEWLLGAYFYRENDYAPSNIFSVDPTTLAVAGQWGPGYQYGLYEESAGFTDLIYHFTDRFDLQLGGRETRIRQNETTFAENLYVSNFGEPPLSVIPTVTERAFTYLITPRFKVSPNLMVYARLASGFRPGAFNNPVPGLPSGSDPDKTNNYELGLKGDFLNHTLTVDTSLYYISWRKLQLMLYNATVAQYYNTNGSAAKSEGVELSVKSRPLPGLTISGWVAWDEAVLTQPFPVGASAYGATGDRLPYSPRISGSISLDQQFPIAAELTGEAGISESYIGDRIGNFTGSAVRQVLPPYAQTNLHASIKYRTWTGELYINNATDKRGALIGGIGEFPPNYFSYITPRTVGLTVAKTF